MIGRLVMRRPVGGWAEHSDPSASAPPAAPPSGPARSRAAPNERRRARSTAKSRPAALEWRDATLPVLGRLRAAAWWPTLLLAGCLVALVYLVQTSGVATTGYDIQRLQAERAEWQLRNEQLHLELAKRRSLTWVEAEATGRLGMQRADAGSTIYLRTNR